MKLERMNPQALLPGPEPDLIDAVPWDERRNPTGYPTMRLHRDALESFGLKESYARAEEAGEFVKVEVEIRPC